ncbi:IS200/IS605 family transposase [Escherichia coli]|nr:IS200/IS605 family transposase [Escherichia coli]MCV8982799.1 IS200/IS605 family transposase [Escherichia coli]
MRFSGPKTSIICSPMTSLKTSIKTITYLSDTGCLEIQGASLADHIHMLVEIPPKMSVSGFMGYLKGKSSLMLYEQFGDLKFKYRNREFWCRGYYVDTVGKNTAKIQDYIKHQLEEDKMGEQLSIPYPGSPFTGRK